MSKELREKYEEVIGLEVHVQLLTNTKAYSSDTNEYGALPNTNISVINLAHPGTLPRSNKQVFDFAIKMGLACKCDITEYNIYDRKNYFYPDLPKGYQLTQDTTPICMGGEVEITTKSGETKTIALNRIHMEEDTGKSSHLDGEVDTLLDLNRAGVPLLEIVTEPVLLNSEEAYAFVTELRKMVRYLGVCDGNLEEGSMRCDANISIRLRGEDLLNPKVEVKNMNSIRNVQRAIEGEIDRQIELTEEGVAIESQTRMFDAGEGITHALRSKEEANDYRFHPEPDLQPVVVDQEWIDRVKADMPALPRELMRKFISDYSLPAYDAVVLTDQKDVALFFDALCGKTKHYKQASNWVMGAVKSYINELTLTINDFPISIDRLAGLIDLVQENKVSSSMANQKLFPEMTKQTDKSALQLAEELGVIQNSNEDSMQPIIDEVLNKFPAEVARYRDGQTQLLGMFMGQVMKAGKGKVDPKVATKLLKETLDK
jgi:aspartyl-tRNA(Asn)/glutamyl-tRNA(Gln) amidotransferase subunit B